MAVPTSDAKLAQYATTFNDLGVAAPTDYGLVTAQMTQFTSLYQTYLDAYNAAKADGSRSRMLVQAKDDAKNALVGFARILYAIVQTAPSVTNENKVAIGVTPRSSSRTPVTPPGLSPVVTCVSVTGYTGRYNLRDRQTGSGRRKPANAKGALILSFVGENPPTSDDTRWKIEGQTGKNSFLVQFPETVTPGTKCWVTAMWYSPSGEYSPACPPVQTYLQIGPVSEAA
jgi:hypothetical protein